MKTALSIYQTHLSALAGAFWEWDFEAMLPRIAFPHVAVALDSTVRIGTPEEYLIGARNHREQLDQMGVTEFVQTCSEVKFYPGKDGEIVVGTHDTKTLRNGVHVLHPMKTQGLLVFRDGVWLSKYLISDYPEPLSILEKLLLEDEV